MAFSAASGVLSMMGHLANLGQVAEIGVSLKHQQEQMEWAQRAYRLDARTLRIDLLNAVKEDVRDHHNTHAGRIDTLLLVHILLLTFALATLQFSDQYVPQTADSCPECVEVAYPMLVSIWVYMIAAILILPFWCILMLLWCKLQLDRWMELSVRHLNGELRNTLQPNSSFGEQLSLSSLDAAVSRELEAVEQAVTRLGGFVVDHQDRFAQVWTGECDNMVRASTNFLWVNAVLAVSITSGMFWMFLRNKLASYSRLAMHFMILVSVGLLAPLGYYIGRGRRHPALGGVTSDEYVSCSDDGDGDQPDFLQAGWSSGTQPRVLRRISRSSAAFAAALRSFTSPVNGGSRDAGGSAADSPCAVLPPRAASLGSAGFKQVNRPPAPRSSANLQPRLERSVTWAGSSQRARSAR